MPRSTTSPAFLKTVPRHLYCRARCPHRAAEPRPSRNGPNFIAMTLTPPCSLWTWTLIHGHTCPFPGSHCQPECMENGHRVPSLSSEMNALWSPRPRALACAKAPELRKRPPKQSLMSCAVQKTAAFTQLFAIHGSPTGRFKHSLAGDPKTQAAYTSKPRKMAGFLLEISPLRIDEICQD